VHPAELARLNRSASGPAPGSLEEDIALERIAELRDEETARLHETRQEARRRHWHATRRALSHDPYRG
jgi:hypothetical protein